MERIWKKPVVVFYVEQKQPRERNALAVIKAGRLVLTGDSDDGPFAGTIEDFFPMMGEVDGISATKDGSQRYVFCWPDDAEDDPEKAWKRLTGVAFSKELRFTVDEKDKRSYFADFTAQKGKLD